MHTGRASWLWSEDGIFRTEFLIGKGEVENPETVNDIPGGTRESIRIGIIFTKVGNNKILVVDMAAAVNR